MINIHSQAGYQPGSSTVDNLSPVRVYTQYVLDEKQDLLEGRSAHVSCRFTSALPNADVMFAQVWHPALN